MECLSSLLVTINTEMIIFNIRLSIVTKLNHEIQEQWYLAPMLVYDSFIHELSPRSLWFQNTNWYKKFGLLAMILALECLSSLLVTINTEMIIFNIRLSIVTKLNHEIQEQWYLAPMLVYDSFIHELSPRSLWFQNTNWYKKFGLLAMILALICFVSLSVDSCSCKKNWRKTFTKLKLKLVFCIDKCKPESSGAGALL